MGIIMDIHKKVLELKAKLEIKKQEIALKKLELENISDELFKTEWIRFTWDELFLWLKKNKPPESKYYNNPTVKSISGYHSSYCFITDKDELQIGAYYHNDHFPRGEDIYVAYDFRTWG